MREWRTLPDCSLRLKIFFSLLSFPGVGFFADASAGADDAFIVAATGAGFAFDFADTGDNFTFVGNGFTGSAASIAFADACDAFAGSSVFRTDDASVIE